MTRYRKAVIGWILLAVLVVGGWGALFVAGLTSPPDLLYGSPPESDRAYCEAKAALRAGQEWEARWEQGHR